MLSSFDHLYNFQLYSMILKEVDISIDESINPVNKLTKVNNKRGSIKQFIKRKGFHIVNNFASQKSNSTWVCDFGISNLK